LRDGLLTHLID